MIAIQTAVVLLVAPALTAGAICVDKSRGTLDHVFVTDLTAREIVFGKLGSRLLTLLTLLASGLPVLALGGLLGGIDPLATIGSFAVAVGTAVAASALALTFSIWARKTHQALLATYAVLLVWSIGPELCLEFPITRNIILDYDIGWIIVLSSPIQCHFAFELRPLPFAPFALQVAYFFATVLFGLALVALASRVIRPVVLAQASRPARRPRPGMIARLMARLPEPPLDGNPVLWREWHRKRPTPWTGRLWTLYAIVGTLASAWVIGAYYLRPRSIAAESAAFVNGVGVTVGLFLLSISAPLALADERDRGSLDVIMTTPLSTWSIVWGKWWGTFAIVPRLAILPIWVTTALSLISGRWREWFLLIGLILSAAAAITSIGWLRPPGAVDRTARWSGASWPTSRC